MAVYERDVRGFRLYLKYNWNISVILIVRLLFVLQVKALWSTCTQVLHQLGMGS